MRLHILIFVLVLTVHPEASARLGETEQELIARYGQPSEVAGYPGSTAKAFTFKRWDVIVYLLDGQSARESFFRIGESGSKRELTQSDIDSILGANARGADWKPVQKVLVSEEELEVGSRDRTSIVAEKVVLHGWALDDGSQAAFTRASDSNGNFVDELDVLTRTWRDHVVAVRQKRKKDTVEKSGL
jgi:hypothetical protein